MSKDPDNSPSPLETNKIHLMKEILKNDTTIIYEYKVFKLFGKFLNEYENLKEYKEKFYF